MKLATLCYVQKNGKTLMIHRVKKSNDMHAGKWNGLGGKLEPGESPEECVIREVFEESGLLIKQPKLRGFLTFPSFSNNEDWYTFVFTAANFEGELIESHEGIFQWVADEKITDLELWEGDQFFIPWLDRDQFFLGKFNYRDGDLINYSVTFH